MPVQRHRITISSRGKEVFRAEYEFDYGDLEAHFGAMNDALDRSGYGDKMGPEWEVRTKVETLPDDQP